ncbi:hypothetical protein SNEBB_002232 [Seison nebaliae]|nr:hypothetical protein SNEBB_002232 [Seison nebaliae]
MVIDHKSSKLIKLNNLCSDEEQSDNDDIVDPNDLSISRNINTIEREIEELLEDTGMTQPPKVAHEIVNGISQPIAQKPHRSSEKKRTAMEEISREMQANGIIEKLESDWCSNVVIVPK